MIYKHFEGESNRFLDCFEASDNLTLFAHEDITEFLGGSEGSQKHTFCVLLNFTTERGDAVSHPFFGEEAVRDLCARLLGK